MRLFVLNVIMWSAILLTLPLTSIIFLTRISWFAAEEAIDRLIMWGNR